MEVRTWNSSTRRLVLYNGRWFEGEAGAEIENEWLVRGNAFPITSLEAKEWLVRNGYEIPGPGPGPGPEKPGLQKPVVHLNGSGRDNLLRDYCAARNEVRIALGTLSDCYPHLRDYHVLPDWEAAYERAVAEHESRAKRLNSVVLELDELTDAVVKGG